MVKKEAPMLILNKQQFEEKIDQQRYYLLQGRIGQIKDSIVPEDTDWYLRGWRYNDNERIAYMIIGDIVKETKDQDGHHNYEAANAKFISMDTHQIDVYIKKSVLESASADHWYAFEKEW